MHICADSFADSLICDEKIEEICKLDFINYKEPCYRAIKHTNDMVLSQNDFLPSIMERNNNVMPDAENQMRRKGYKDFSVSVNRSLEELKEIVRTVPTLRDSVFSYAVGFYSKKKGVVTRPDNKGHIHYFLFDPEEKNPVLDFRYVIV